MYLGPCAVLGELARGEHTATYRARWEPLGQEVVVKVLEAPGLDPRRAAWLAGELRRQGQDLLRLRHPHAVRVLLAGETGAGAPYLVMERVPGARRLDQLLLEGLAPEALAALVEQVALAVQHAHERGIVHGLLDARDVVLNERGEAVVLGFGRGLRELATRRKPTAPSLLALFSGAPELVAGHAPGPACDVFGLGTILYAGLTGREALASGNLSPQSRQTRLPLPPSYYRPDADPVLEAIAMKCLQLVPGARFASARAVAQALAARRGGAEGARTIGPYRLIDELGRGGMARVWRALDTRSERQVALKVMLTGEHGTPVPDALLARFEREVRLLRGLDHPHLVKILDAGRHEGRPWLAMELIEGATLEALAEGRRLPPRQVAGVMAQVASALHHAHERGVVHRDLKPGNVLVRPDGHAYLADFGLAKSLRAASEDAAPVTKRWAVVGTPSFLSPEQVTNGSRVGPASDVFALGLTLWAALAGQAPFERSSLATTLQAVLHAALPSLRELRPDVDPVLERVVQRCLERDPSRRYASAAEVAEDLRLLASSQAGMRRSA